MDISTLEAGPELDALIAANVMGWYKVGKMWCVGANSFAAQAEELEGCPKVWSPSTDIGAAWAVALVLKQRFRRIELSGDTEDGGTPFFWFEIGGESEDPDFQYIASTAELAICKAALLATEKIQ